MPEKIPALLKDLVEVPGPLRSFYTATKDGWQLQVDGEPVGFVRAEKLNEFRDNNRAAHRKIAEQDAQIAALKEHTPMGLKAIVHKTEFDALPEATRTLYKAQGDKFVLDVDGGLVEVGDLKSKLSDAQSRLKTFDGVDPAEHKRLTARVTELEAQLATTAAEKATAQQSAADATFRSVVGAEFLKAGGRGDALDFIVGKARDVFTLGTDGKLSTKEFSAARPGEPLGVSEFIAQRLVDSAFAFQPSSGGGARPSKGDSGKRTIARGDAVAFGQNLHEIAAGEVTVE